MIPQTMLDLVNELLPRATPEGAYVMGIATAVADSFGVAPPRDLLEQVCSETSLQQGFDLMNGYVNRLKKGIYDRARKAPK